MKRIKAKVEGRRMIFFLFFFHLFIWGIFSFPHFTIPDHLELVLALSWRDHVRKALIYGTAEHIIEQ
jgi:hypothetical protein